MNELLKKVVVGITTMAMVITMVPVVPAVAETPVQGDDRVIFNRMWGPVNLGDTGRNVAALQAVLVEEGLLADDSAEIAVRAYGEETKVAVVAFKHRYEAEIEATLTRKGLQIDADGYGQLFFTPFVGPATMAQVNEIVAQLNRVTEVPEVPEVPKVIDPTVAISAENPAARTVPKSATLVDVLKFDITAGTEDLTISEMTFRRTGVGESTDFEGLHLFKDGIRLTRTPRSLVEETVTFVALEDVMIKSGETATFALKANIHENAKTGGESAFKLTAIEAGEIEVEGLPIQGEPQRIGAVSVATVELVSGDAIINQVVGSNDAEIANFRLEAEGAPTLVKQILVEVRGTISRGDVTNLTLLHNDEEISTSVTVDERDRHVFIIEDGILIDEGDTETFSITADIQGRDEDTLYVYISETADILAIDQNLGFGSIVNLADNERIGEQTLEGGALVVHAENPAAGNIAIGAEDVVLAGVRLLSERDIEIRDIVVTIEGDYEIVENLKIVDVATDRILVSRTDDIVSGNNVIPGSIFLTAGVERTLDIVVDVKENAIADQTIRAVVRIGNADIRDLELGTKIDDIINPTITANLQTIVEIGANAILLGVPRDTTVVTGEEDIPAVAFDILAIGGDIEVKQITAQIRVDDVANFASPLTGADIAAVVTSVNLLSGEEIIATETVTDGEVIFTNINKTIIDDKEKTFTMEIDLASGLTTRYYVAVVIKRGDIKLVDAIDNDPIELPSPNDYINAPGGVERTVITVETAGTLQVDTYANTPETTIVPVGEYGAEDVKLVIAEVNAEKEAMTIEEVRVLRAAVGDDEAYGVVELVFNNNVVAARIMPDAAYVDFKGLNIEVPLEGTHKLSAQANIAGVGFGVASGDDIGFDIQVMKATGVYSGLSGVTLVSTPGADKGGDLTAVAEERVSAAGTRATIDVRDGGASDYLILTADKPGPAGNEITYQTASVTPGANLGISVVDSAITVTLATTPSATGYAGGTITSTNLDVANLITAHAPAAALVDIEIMGNANALALAVVDPLRLTGGTPAYATPGTIRVDTVTGLDRGETFTVKVGDIATVTATVIGDVISPASVAADIHTALNANAAVIDEYTVTVNANTVTLTDRVPGIAGNQTITITGEPTGTTYTIANPAGGRDAPTEQSTITLDVGGVGAVVGDKITVTVDGHSITHTVNAANLTGADNAADLALIAKDIRTAINANSNIAAILAEVAEPTNNVITLVAETPGDGFALEVAVDQVRAPTTYAGPAANGELMIVRQTVPTVSTVKGSTTLRNGENHIMTVTISADAKDDVTIESLGVHLILNGVTVNDFIVREGGEIVPDIAIAEGAGDNTITFTTPEIIAAGESKTYAIFVFVAGADADGDSIISQLTDRGFAWGDGAERGIDSAHVDTIPSASFTISF